MGVWLFNWQYAELIRKLERIYKILEVIEDRGNPPKRPPVTIQIFFGQIGETMSTAVIHTNNHGVSAALVPKDSSGNVVPLGGIPAWSLSADGIVNMTVAPDGLSAQFAPVAVGTVTVNVVAEGDAVPGVDTLHSTGDINVLGAEATTLEMTFGPVT